MSEFICSNCNQSGFIVSVEVITEAFPCGPDGKGGIEYDGTGGKLWHTEREYYMCTNCDHTYHTDAELLALEVSE